MALKIVAHAETSATVFVVARCACRVHARTKTYFSFCFAIKICCDGVAPLILHGHCNAALIYACWRSTAHAEQHNNVPCTFKSFENVPHMLQIETTSIFFPTIARVTFPLNVTKVAFLLHLLQFPVARLKKNTIYVQPQIC